MIKKLLILLFVFTFIAVLATYFFGSRILNKSIKAGVETFGPKVTQTPVRLDEVKLSILSGDGRLSGLYVGNPDGFSSENIFTLGKVEVDIEARSLFSNQIIIKKIHIKEPQIRYEKTLKTSNLKELLANIEESTGSDDTTETEEPQAEDSLEEESDTEVLVEEFIIENPKVFLGIIGLGTTIPLPSIELTNISSSKQKIATTILTQVIEKLSESIKSASVDTAGGTADAAKNVLNSIKDQSEESLKKQATDSIKNLLGK